MVSVNDASSTSTNLERQRRLLAESDIDDRDREAIKKFTQHRRLHGTERSGTYADSSETADLSKLRLSSERASVALVDMGMDDLNDLLATLKAPKDEGGHGIENGIDSYTRALRVFFRWLHRHDEYGEFSWWEQVKTGNVDFPDPSDRNFPDRDDYDAMMEAGRGDPRAQAILAFYWESAVRRTLGAQLRLGDLHLDGQRATFTPNPNGARQKDVEIKKYPLYNGLAKLRVWVNAHHPDPNNPDAPLFPVAQGYDPENPEECALSANRIADTLKDLGDRAGVEAETKPHAFRHAAVGRWKARGYSLGQVQRRTAWSDRSAAEMWGRYGDPDDDDMDRGIDELEGHDNPDAADEAAGETAEPREKWTCPECALEGIENGTCPECGTNRDEFSGVVEFNETESGSKVASITTPDGEQINVVIERAQSASD